MYKKIISALLCVILILSCAPMAFAIDSEATLYGFYGDSMLFAQNKEAIFAGTASENSVITVELLNSENEVIRTSTTIATNGVFEVSFNAPKGSYEEYTVILSEDGTEFKRLKNVVFGELWLASGQSNMAYPLKKSVPGRDMFEKGEKLSKWLRVLLVPQIPEYNGSTETTPLNPLDNIAGSQWVDGESINIYNMSAVGYFFASSLMEKLDMPVGVLNDSLSGSRICSWLSRDAIDSCEEVKSLYEKNGFYIEESEWDENSQDRYFDMSCIYNLKINPIRHFRPSGMIWYQGESDLIIRYTPEEYAAQLDLLQRSYSELFGYEDELMPLINTHLAAFMYYTKDSLELIDWNMYLSEFKALEPDSRAVVSIYDLPLTYIPENGLLHPECKEQLGIRMADCAENLVYNGSGAKSLANVESYKIEGSSIYVTFDENIGDGLKVKGDKLLGFAICSGNGIYLPAEAEIVTGNTVRIYSEKILLPVSATYAYGVNNLRSNLYATENGELTMPVNPFVLKRVDDAHYWRDRAWADCDDPELFQNYEFSSAAYYPTWKSDANLTFNSKDAHSGTNGLNIKASSGKFSIMPVTTYIDSDGELDTFNEIDRDYRDYKTISFYVRNNSDSPITLNSIKLYTKNLKLLWYSPVNAQTKTLETVIPADNQWHLVTYNLNSLYLAGDTKGLIYSNSKLKYVQEIEFNFSSDSSADISIDEFTFSSDSNEDNTNVDKNFSLFKSIGTILKAVFKNLFEIFLNLFR